MYILIVEDELRLGDTLSAMMRENHYSYDIVRNGEDGLSYGESNLYDVILLDIMLPGIDGLTVLRKLRERKIQTPVILLTARDDINDKVRGLDCGADDYITKPFSKEELFARIRANSRRQGEMAIDELQYADLTLHLTNYTLRCGKKEVRLGFKEYAIVRILASNPGQLIPKSELLTKVWGYLSEAESNSVEVYISFLRKKLAYLESEVCVETVRKVGYRMCRKQDVPGGVK